MFFFKKFFRLLFGFRTRLQSNLIIDRDPDIEPYSLR